MTPQTEVATELLTRHPKAASLTLARIAYKENPEVFASLEAARTVIRKHRGASGKKHRAMMKDKTHVREPQAPGDPFAKLPDGKTHFKALWGAVKIEGPARALILSDAHIPYHDKTALESALRYGIDNRATHVILNGDILDFFSVSFWEKDPRERDFAAEIKTGREFLAMVRDAFPQARITYKLGNHEERYERYLSVKAPELLGVDDFKFEAILGLSLYSIELVREKRPIRLGKLNLLHGHEYRFAMSNPVNPARGFFLKAKTHILGGHLHQTSQHSEKNLEQKVVSAWSTGCLCDLHPDYSPINSWNHGFAFVEVDADGVFNVHNLKVIEGKVY